MVIVTSVQNAKTSDSDMEDETAIRAKLFRGETEQVRKVIENQKRAMK